MNICILDDTTFTIEHVKKMILSSCEELKISEPNIFSFVSPEDFTDWIHSHHNLDVCFLDVNLEHKIDGLEIAKLIKDTNYHTLIVFMTSYDSYFPDMVQVEPFRFLPKPIESKKFSDIFHAVYDRIILKKSEEHVPIYKCKNNGIIFPVNLNEVIYFTSYKRKIYVHDTKNFNVEFYGKLDDVEKEIRSLSNKYIRINKSYLLNKDYIENIGKNSVSVEGVTYAISPKYRNNLKIIT